MPVNKDASGRRWVQAEVEVPGSPEQVWEAIASGPGISSWFVPTEVEQREGGAITANFGPGMESLSTVTSWEPPHRFTADSRDDMGPGDPTIATEWIVEARAGGTCVVRVVHSWFASTDDWDNQFEGHVHGWQAFFRILKLYLSRFAGQPASAFQLMGVSAEPPSQAWEKLTGALGISASDVGQRVESTAGAPRLAGAVEHIGTPDHPELLLRLEEPSPGIAHVFAMPMGDTYLPMRVFFYGEQAEAVAAREEAALQAWMAEQFPPSGSAE